MTEKEFTDIAAELRSFVLRTAISEDTAQDSIFGSVFEKLAVFLCQVARLHYLCRRFPQKESPGISAALKKDSHRQQL